ncbi:MAG: HAD family hydrolase [Alphaproteobacteria bacterium]
MKIKAIFFDFDGVLTTDKSGSVSTAKYFSKKLGVSPEELVASYKEHFADADHKIDIGEAQNNIIWQSMCESFDVEYNPDWINEAFDTSPIDNKMVEFAKKLKEKFIVGIITDNGKDRADYIFPKHKFNEIFNPIIISAYVKTIKAGTEIFEIAANRAGVNPDECIFIDNTPKNLVSAERLGIAGIHFDDAVRDYEKLFNDVEKIIKL